MSSLRILVLAALAILMAAGGTIARADGKFIPSYTLRPVEIPTQSAAVSFSEGKQVLTIWNTIQTSAGETAWVLPLPAKPDAIQKTSPEAFRLLEMLCAPEVQAHGDGLSTGQIWALGIFCVGWGLIFLRLRRPSEDMLDELRFLRWMGLGLCMIVSIFVLLGATGGLGMSKFKSASAGAPVAGVQQLDAQSVGAYEATVLSATGSGPLNEWLKTGGFPEFTGAELAVVDDYAAKGWVFLCARMKLDQGKPSHAPHPLTVRFPTEKVIYPMRLTAGSGPTVEVRLFVIDLSPAQDPTGRLATFVHAPLYDRAHRLGHGSAGMLGPDAACYYESVRSASGNERVRGEWIPPDLLYDSLLENWMWGGKVSLLTGTFRPDSNWSDVLLDWATKPTSPPPHTTAVTLARARLSRAIQVAAPLFLLLSILARITTPMNGSRPSLRRFLTVTSVSVITFAAIVFIPWNTSGVVIVPESSISRGRDSREESRRLYSRWLEDITRQLPPRPTAPRSDPPGPQE